MAMASSTARTLCSQCERFDIQAFGSSSYPFRGLLLSTVVQSSENGCSFCSLLVEGLDQHWDLREHWLKRMFWPSYVQFEAHRDTNARDLESGSLGIRQISVSIQCLDSISRQLWPPASWGMPPVNFNTSADEGTPAHTSNDVTGDLLGSTTKFSEKLVEAIQKWHAHCSNTHPNCSKTLSRTETINPDSVPLPSRCIEFQKVPGSNPDHYHFWLRETEGMTGSYVILSHRWGEFTKASSTTSENYQERVFGQPGSIHGEAIDGGPGWINDQQLSRLFLDAGILTANLGIKYIWIDSICIIQGDLSDWDKEATLMAGYYQYAWVTISATLTDNEGFLRPGQDMCCTPSISRLPYRNKEGKQDGYFYLQNVSSSMISEQFLDGISESDLLRRGWVFQEWMLSRRIICFSNLVPFLICVSGPPLPTITMSLFPASGNETDSQEPYTGFVLEEEERGHIFLPYIHETIGLDKRLKPLIGPGLSTKRAFVFATWRRIITSCSDLDLTQFDNDRLVSLAGIAREVGKALESMPVSGSGERGPGERLKYSNTYACGLWLGDIARELQWQSAGSTSRVARVQGFPSWSWLSFASESLESKGTPEGPPTLKGSEVCWYPFERRKQPILYGKVAIKEIPNRVCSITLEAAYNVPLTKSAEGYQVDLEQNHEWAILDPYSGTNDYGNSRRFIALHLGQAKLIRVNLGPHFDSELHSELAAACTAQPNLENAHWRSVTVPKSLGIIRGWASLEHREYQTPGRDPSETPVMALRLIRLPEVGVLPGLLTSHSETAVVVLFVRQIVQGGEGRRPLFERLGVGRLFGSEVEKEFGAVEEGYIWLV